MIGAEETVRVRYHKNQPQVEAERRSTPRQDAQAASARARKGRPAPSKQGKRLSNAKREQRERRQQVVKLRRAGVVALALAVVFACAWAVVAAANAPVFRVDSTVVTGNRHLTTDQVVAIARIPDATSLFRIPVSEVEKRIAASPWVAGVSVTRDFPSTVRIDITERTPAVTIDAGGSELWVVSRDGRWLGERTASESETIVVRDVPDVEPRPGREVKSPEIENAIRLATGLSAELKKATRSISAPSVDQTAIITEDDIEIFFGEAAQVAQKDRIAREILRRQEGKVVYINVRVVERPTWRGLTSTP